jgi:hypothetical protein
MDITLAIMNNNNTVERKQKKEASRNHIQIARRQQGWG